MSEAEESQTKLKPAAKFVAYLVAIPSIINLAGDVWVSLNNLPVGDKEKTNYALFRDHFQETPIHTKQIIIETKTGQWPLNLEVYGNGDVFFKSGYEGQWFASNNLNLSSNEFNLISSAYASDLPTKMTISSTPVKITTKINANKEIVKSKTMFDGSIETETINPNSAKTISIEITPPPVNEIFGPAYREPVEIIKLPEENHQPIEVLRVD